MPSVEQKFLTPVMRLVQGSPLEAQTKDHKTGQPLTIKTGPNAGQPTQKFFVAVAGRKGDPEVEALKKQFEDGDGYDDQGQPNNVKIGFAGHWVFRFSSSYAPSWSDRCPVPTITGARSSTAARRRDRAPGLQRLVPLGVRERQDDGATH